MKALLAKVVYVEIAGIGLYIFPVYLKMYSSKFQTKASQTAEVEQTT